MTRNTSWTRALPRRTWAAVAVLTLGGAVASVGDESSARAAGPYNCKLASCGDPGWVAACNAATTCARIPPANANLGDRAPTLTPRSMGGKVVPSAHHMPPQIQVQKKPRVIFGGALVTPKSYPLPSTQWQTAPGAPALKTIDRRRLAARVGLNTSDAMQTFGVTLAGMQAQWTLEDQKAAQRAREDAAIVNRRPQWVGDPTKVNYHGTTPNSAVSSCDDYAYKKTFDQAWFRDAALALGTDYRAVWSIATRADSPVRINRVLWSYSGPPITPAVSEDALAGGAGNVFLAYLDTQSSPASPASPTAHGWALAGQLEQAHRAITDAEFDDIERREQRFSDMLTQLFNTKFRLATMLCKKTGGSISQDENTDELTCVPGSGNNGGGGGTSKDPPDGKKHPKQKAPDPAFNARKAGRPLLGAALRGHPTLNVAGPQSTAAARAAHAPIVTAAIKAVDRFTTRFGAPPSTAFRATTGTPTISGGGANVVGSGGRNGMDTSACEKPGLTPIDLQICYIRAEVHAIQADINDAVQLEKNLGAAGCVYPDAVSNHCNWSYKKFAEHLAAELDWSYVAKDCKARIDDFGALNDPTKQKALANNRTLFATDIVKNYAQSWTSVDAWLRALNDAPAKWLEYEKARLVYMKAVAATVRQAAGMPRVSGGYGTTSGDGFDVGHPDTFGGGAHYGFSWNVKPVQLGKPFYSADTSCGGGTPCGVEQRICRFNGAINATADARASLFGFDITLLDAKVTAYAEDNAKHGGNGAHLDAHFTLLGNELFTQEVTNGINQPSAPTYNIARPVADTSASYPDPPLEMGFMVGPIPVTLEAGMSLGAGIDLASRGVVDDTCAAAAGTQPHFSLSAALNPHVQADAFGQAGVDLAVVEAGVRINLNLVQVGLPVGFGMTVDGPTTTLDAKADLTLAALSGNVAIFAEVHYVVETDDYELPIFSWNGISSSRSLLDDKTTFPTDALSYLMHPPEPWRTLSTQP